MSNKVKVALIGLAGAIISAVISVPITSVVVGNKTNQNNNSLVVNVDGGTQTITPEQHLEVVKENGRLLSYSETLKNENEKLKEQYDALLKKYNELSSDLPMSNDTSHATDLQNSQDTASRVPLKDLFIIDSEGYDVIEGIQDSYGNSHGIVYKFDASLNAYAEFNLDYNYDSFSCKIITSPETNRDANIKIIVMTEDGTEIGVVDNINKHEESYSLGPINISGKKKLVIKSFNTGAYYNGFCYLTDVVLQ